MTRLKRFIDSLGCFFGDHEPLVEVHPQLRPDGPVLMQCPRCHWGQWEQPQGLTKGFVPGGQIVMWTGSTGNSSGPHVHIRAPHL